MDKTPMWQINDHSSDSHQMMPLDEGAGNIDILHYWNLFWGNKFKIAAMGLLFAIPTAFYMKSLPSTFQSTASLMLESQRAKITTIEDLYGIDTQSGTYTTTQFELIQSRNLAERVVRNMNLLEHPEFVILEDEYIEDNSTPWWSYLPQSVHKYFELTEEEDSTNQVSDEQLLNFVINQFSRRLSVVPVNNTSLVKITFTATDPVLAADIANGIANAYIENDMEQRLEATQTASRWLSERVTSLNQTLQQSEQRLQAFLIQEQLVDIGGITTLAEQEVDELSDQLIEVQDQKQETEGLYNQVQALENSTIEELLELPVIYNQSSIQLAKRNADNVAQEIAELSNRYGRNHPRMIELQAEYDLVQSNLHSSVRQLISSIESSYQNVLLNEQNTLNRLNQAKSKLQDLSTKNYQLEELQREVETNRQLYNLFFTRNIETKETNDFQTTSAILVDPAIPAIFATGPSRKRSVILAMMAGLMLGAGLVLLRDMLNNTISNFDDVELKLKVPLLGVVPLIQAEKRGKKNVLTSKDILDELRNKYTESFRTIRSSITLSSIDKPYKVLAITSTEPGEGKSTVSVNLASILSQLGRVLIIDSDLRRPTLAKNVNLPPNSPGLSNYLAGNDELKDCLYHLKEYNISVLPAGQVVPDPIELFSSDKFKKLIESFSQKYDYIILDTPPTKAVSDSLILGNLADAVIMVVKANFTTTNNVKNQLIRLFKARNNVIGCILNQLDIEANNAYGGYYDTYGYSAGSQK